MNNFAPSLAMAQSPTAYMPSMAQPSAAFMPSMADVNSPGFGAPIPLTPVIAPGMEGVDTGLGADSGLAEGGGGELDVGLVPGPIGLLLFLLKKLLLLKKLKKISLLPALPAIVAVAVAVAIVVVFVVVVVARIVVVVVPVVAPGLARRLFGVRERKKYYSSYENAPVNYYSKEENSPAEYQGGSSASYENGPDYSSPDNYRQKEERRRREADSKKQANSGLPVLSVDQVEKLTQVIFAALRSQECNQRLLCEAGSLSRSFSSTTHSITKAVKQFVPDSLKSGYDIFTDGRKCERFTCEPLKARN